MSEKKYILTDETMKFKGHMLHRIQAVKDFEIATSYDYARDIRSGDCGGWVESEYNLSQFGTCWVADDAKVFGHAHVSRNALALGGSIIKDLAMISDQALVCDAIISDRAIVCGKAAVCFGACVKNQAVVCNDARVEHSAFVAGDAKVSNGATIDRHGIIYATRDWLRVGPLGSRDDFTTFYKTKNDIWVSCGCFNDSILVFEERVRSVHGNEEYCTEYLEAIEFAKKRLRR